MFFCGRKNYCRSPRPSAENISGADFERALGIKSALTRITHPQQSLSKGGGLAKRPQFAVPRRGAGVSNQSGLLAGLPESLPLLTSPPDPRRPSYPPGVTTPAAFFRTFFGFFGARKNGQKTDGQKIDFFRQFWRFWCLRRRFWASFGPKTSLRRLLFRCFFENGDFVKIVLPLWWEQHFQGSDPPKISP